MHALSVYRALGSHGSRTSKSKLAVCSGVTASEVYVRHRWKDIPAAGGTNILVGSSEGPSSEHARCQGLPGPNLLPHLAGPLIPSDRVCLQYYTLDHSCTHGKARRAGVENL